jgi:hypothetical protein
MSGEDPKTRTARLQSLGPESRHVTDVDEEPADDVPRTRRTTRRDRRKTEDQERDRDREREHSRSFAQATIDKIDVLARQRFGAGLSPELRVLVADELEHQLARAVARLQEGRDPGSSGVISVPLVPPNSGANATNAANPVAVPIARAAIVTSVVSAVVLLLTIMVGAVVAGRLADRLTSLDASQRERILAAEARLTDSENRQIELTKKVDDQHSKDSATDAEQERRLKLLEDRQMALVYYLLYSVEELLKDRGIQLPHVPTTLRIAEAEAEDVLGPKAKAKP